MNNFKGLTSIPMLLMMAATLLVAGCGSDNNAAGGGATLYGVDRNNGGLYTLNTSNGEIVRAIGSTGQRVTSMAVHPTTRVLYGVSGSSSPNSRSLLTINKSTGASTVVGALGASVKGIGFTSNGTLYGWEYRFIANANLYTIDLTTGAATVVGLSGVGRGRGGMAVSSTGVLFGVPDVDTDNLYTLNTTTGVATAGPFLNGLDGDTIYSLAFSGNTLYGMRNRDELIIINTTTGAIIPNVRQNYNMTAIAFD